MVDKNKIKTDPGDAGAFKGLSDMVSGLDMKAGFVKQMLKMAGGLLSADDKRKMTEAIDTFHRAAPLFLDVCRESVAFNQLKAVDEGWIKAGQMDPDAVRFLFERYGITVE